MHRTNWLVAWQKVRSADDVCCRGINSAPAGWLSVWETSSRAGYGGVMRGWIVNNSGRKVT